MRVILVLAAALAALGGCVMQPAPVGGGDLKAQVAQILKDNPDILFDIIRDNPKDFFAVVDVASKAADDDKQSAEDDAEQKQIVADLAKPVPADDIAGRITLGDPNAKLVVVMYSDTQCPYCRRALGTMWELMEKYPVKLVYKHLAVHSYAAGMGAYVEAAGEQGKEKAEALIRAIYDEGFQAKVNKQPDIEPVLKMLDEVLLKAGGDPKKARAAAQTDRIKAVLAKDEEEAGKLGFEGTPGFIAAGVRLNGAYPAEVFSAIFEQRLEEAKKN